MNGNQTGLDSISSVMCVKIYLLEYLIPEPRFYQFCNISLIKVSYEYRDHTFFHALTFAGSRGCCLNTKLIGQNIKHFRGTPQVLMQ